MFERTGKEATIGSGKKKHKYSDDDYSDVNYTDEEMEMEEVEHPPEGNDDLFSGPDR